MIFIFQKDYMSSSTKALVHVSWTICIDFTMKIRTFYTITQLCACICIKDYVTYTAKELCMEISKVGLGYKCNA